jgi:hypothetical protein
MIGFLRDQLTLDQFSTDDFSCDDFSFDEFPEHWYHANANGDKHAVWTWL